MIGGFFALQSSGGEDESAPLPPTPVASTAPAAGTAASTNTATTSAAPATQPAPAATPVRLAQAPKKTIVAKAPVVPAPNVATVEAPRPDPFEPFYYPMPEPEPTPTPVPPPVRLPPPPAVTLPSPRGGGAPLSVAFAAPGLASAPPSTALIGLPRPHIARYNPLPGPVWNRVGTSPRAPDAPVIRSANKRLSGVIIGDSVRALLEITTGETAGGGAGGGEGGAAGATTIVRVVQPGDEVDGIRILRIERIFEGGKQITRMFVREGTEERFVDLRASPTPPVTAGGGSSEGGPPAPPGAPFGAIRPVPR